MKSVLSSDAFDYIETPRRSGSLTKIDEILEERMRAFMKARRLKRFTFSR
jgi:hypothetical protein